MGNYNPINHNFEILFNFQLYIHIKYPMGFNKAVEFKFCTRIFPSLSILFNRVYNQRKSCIDSNVMY